MTSPLHPFDQAIALEEQATGQYAGHTSEAYWNAISPFGGATAATLLESALHHPQRLGDPLALTVNFAGPVQKGSLTVHATPVRTSRSTQHWHMQLLQEGDAAPAATASAVFAVRRPGWRDTESDMPSLPPAEETVRMTPPPEIPFLSRYALRYPAQQSFQPGDTSRSACWIEDVPPRPLDHRSLVAYCDVFMPRIFLRRGRVPIATVTLSINFHIDAAALLETPVLRALGVARANVFHDGYHDQEAQIWTPEGRLLATTHQMVWHRDGT